MSQYILGNDIRWYTAGTGVTVLKAGKTLDTKVYDLGSLRKVGAILYPVTPATLARAAQLQAQDALGQHGGLQDERARIDSVGPFCNPPATASTSATVTHATSPYTAQASDTYIEADVSGGTVTIDLYALPSAFQELTIKNSAGDASVNVITVAGNGNQVEDPNNPGTLASSVSIRVAGASVTWTFDGTAWRI